jgi:hypothetical protein
MPSGFTSPHGCRPIGSGVPILVCQRTAPVARFSPYTWSDSVAAITVLPMTSGSP